MKNSGISKICLLSLLFTALSPMSRAQDVALKTNLFYGIYTYTPNLGMEIALGQRSTFEVSGGYNPWNLNGSAEDNKKLVHWLGTVEYRYWLCRKFNGHFFGVHALGGQFNIARHELPLLLGKGSRNYRYQGWGVGAGLTYGYQFVLGRHWNLEASAGIGYARLHYDKYDCIKCGRKLGTESRNYFGPTKAALSLVYLF
ncbi:MAG: DUF3575 domain-containing protein [Rikenellaceae bacterium]|nr:DUF3575 domain-containing protein [Rikenellaceae bacterium]